MFNEADNLQLIVPIGTAIPLGSDKNLEALTGSLPTNKTQTDSLTFTASVLK